MPFEGLTASVWVDVGLVLGDLHPLDQLPQRSTVPGTVFTDDSNFLGPFSHFCLNYLKKIKLILKNERVLKYAP